MKELLNRFSFGDFVAYFLPGLATVGAIAGLLRFTPFRHPLAQFSGDLGVLEVLLIACAAYVIGAIVSGMGARLLPPLFAATRLQRLRDPRAEVEPEVFAHEVKAAFGRVFPYSEISPWSPSHFYLLRSAVHHVSPHAALECSRQNSLMQLRENLLLPVVTWGFVGILFAIDEFGRSPGFSLGVGTASIIGAYLVAGRIAWRAVENRRREVREACLGFLVAERLRLFQRTGEDSSAVVKDKPRSLTQPVPDVLPVRADIVGTA
jgi:hypothetical protein